MKLNNKDNKPKNNFNNNYQNSNKNDDSDSNYQTSNQLEEPGQARKRMHRVASKLLLKDKKNKELPCEVNYKGLIDKLEEPLYEFMLKTK